LFISNLKAFSFSCLIALARTSRTMLNRSGKSSHPWLVPDFPGRAFFHHCLLCFFTYCFCYVKVVSFYSYFVECFFFSWKGVEFCQMLFLHQGDCFSHFDVAYHIYQFLCIESSLHSKKKKNASWSWCIIALICWIVC